MSQGSHVACPNPKERRTDKGNKSKREEKIKENSMNKRKL
jgi:hypothetical protein